ncbi:MAG: MOSC domain-containing protein [Solirubrobacteraceae bacterium]|nr:MOSC domain-containing protein [Solirubrobacteraceae bacterium]
MLTGIESATVTALATTPVKGMRVVARKAIGLSPRGVADNRCFYVVDARDRMVNGKQLGALNEVVASYRVDARELELRFPDGERVAGVVELGEPTMTTFFSVPTPARELLGAFSAALSQHAGQPLRIVEGIERSAVDRGRAGAVSILSRVSLRALERVAGGRPIDARRFRMLVEIDGLGEPHEEDAWIGEQLQIGDAAVLLRGHVGRCLVTNRHPETGAADLPTLDLLRSYRAGLDTTEPLAFGVYGEVLEPGRVCLGDPVTRR